MTSATGPVTVLAAVLRGVRSRGLLSLTSLAMMVLAIAAAVLGPAYQEAATTSYSLSRLADASAPTTALTFDLEPGTEGSLEEVVDAGVAAVERELPQAYSAPEVTILSTPLLRAPDFAEITYLARDDVCALLTVTGRCPTAPGEVLINEADLGRKAIGDTVDGPRLGTLRIVGTYPTPSGPDAVDDWLFPTLLAPRPASNVANRSPGPYIVTEDVIDTLPRRLWFASLDSRLQVPDSMPATEVDRLVTTTERLNAAEIDLGPTGVVTGTSTVNALPAVLADIRVQREAAGSAVAPAVVSLILVALAMLLRLQTATAELRGPELALAALRGVGRRRAWVLGLSEPWLLLVLSVPLGVAAGFGATLALARSSLREGLPITVPTPSILAAALVVLGIAAVSAIAIGQGMRESLGSRLAGVRRPAAPGAGGTLGVVIEVVVIALAALLPLARIGADGDGLGVTDLLLPVAIAIAAGLIGTRVTTWLARWWVERGADRPLSAFVAARAVARRSQGTLVILPVTAAIAIAVFAVGVDSVANRWRDSVAATSAPGDQVWASPLDADANWRLTRSVDPDGRWTMAVTSLAVPDTGPMVLVDSERLARVGHWSEQWLPDGGDGAAAAALLRPTTPVPVLTGTEVALDVDADAPGGAIVLQVRGADEAQYLRLGAIAAGPTTLTVSAPGCRSGCQVLAIEVEDTTGPVRISGLRADSAEATGAAVLGTDWVDSATGRPATVDGDALELEPDQSYEPAVAVAPLRVIEGVSAGDTVHAGESADARVIDAPTGVLPVQVVSRAASVPLAGPGGVLLDLSSYLAQEEPTLALTESMVLVRGDAPASVTTALSDAGLTEEIDAATTRRALDDTAYAQALRLYLVVAAVILLMALGGLLVSTAVQMRGRRRDAASLRVVGVPRRTIVLSSLWESLVVLGTAAVAGLAAGWLAQRVLLGSLTLGLVEDSATPRVQSDPDTARLLLLAGSVGVVLLVVAVLTSVAVVRQARAATLREDAR
ncbi:ABC transporter permease [Nocardioides sp. GXZ039]|uniref:ABC transporter permease n=1 Tax=Nocardioides sp. GXZ039 TaxID=3136018 RepID=UPI0030F48254